MPSSRGCSQPRNQTHVSYVSCIGWQVSKTNSTSEVQKFKSVLTPILLKLSKKLRDKDIPKSFYEGSITLISKLDKDNTEKKNICQYHWWTHSKIFNIILTSWIEQCINRITCQNQVGFIPGMQRWSNIPLSILVIYNTLKKLKNKSHIIIKIGTEKLLTKFNIHLWQKFSINRYRGNMPQHSKINIWQAHS